MRTYLWISPSAHAFSHQVKIELGREYRWIQASEAKITQMSEMEKLTKMQDILGCLNHEQQMEAGEGALKKTMMVRGCERAAGFCGRRWGGHCSHMLCKSHLLLPSLVCRTR